VLFRSSSVRALPAGSLVHSFRSTPQNLVFRRHTMGHKGNDSAEEGLPLHDVVVDDEEEMDVLTYRPTGPSVLLRGAVLLMLTLQTTTFTLLRRYSQAVMKEAYSFGSVLLAAEFIKLLFSLGAIWSKMNPSENTDHIPFGKRLMTNLKLILPMCVPSVIYLTQNLLSFYSLRRVDAATFSLIFQLKLVTTAFFSRILLSKHFTWLQYRSLFLVMLGVLQITLNTIPQHSDHGTPDPNADQYSNQTEFFRGMFAALLEVTLSGVCTVYMEMMFKDKKTQLNIWDRNFQLALTSIPVYLATSYTPGEDFFNDWSWVTVMLTFLSAAGGLLVALCLKYTDSILKGFASTGGILLTTGLSHLLLDGPMNPFIAIASVVVVIAVLNYQLG